MKKEKRRKHNHLDIIEKVKKHIKEQRKTKETRRKEHVDLG